MQNVETRKNNDREMGRRRQKVREVVLSQQISLIDEETTPAGKDVITGPSTPGAAGEVVHGGRRKGEKVA